MAAMDRFAGSEYGSDSLVVSMVPIRNRDQDCKPPQSLVAAMVPIRNRDQNSIKNCFTKMEEKNLSNKNSLLKFAARSGCGAVRLAHHVRDVGAAGSNPVIPTNNAQYRLYWAFFGCG